MEVVEVMPTDTRVAELAPIRFTVQLSAIDDTGLVLLPEVASEQLPSRGQVAVHATIDGHPFGTVVEPDGRRGHWVRWIRATRNLATRQERVEVSLSKMDHGKRRPCCFDLSSCTDPDLARSGKLREPS